jgi:nitrogen fixation NifU-like protein
MLEEARKIYSEKVIEHWMDPRNVGRIDQPQGIGRVTGGCGDTMEISLRIINNRIEDIHFYTEGCGTTAAVGSMTTELVKGKSVPEAFKIDPEDVAAALDGLPEEHFHCAELAVDTLQAALRDYLAYKREPWKRGYAKP